MGHFGLLAIAVTVSLVASQEPPGGYYQTKYDALDVEEVLNHKRLVHHYAACLLNRGSCPPQGADLKRILPEALRTNCLRCTEKQKYIALRTLRRLRKEYSNLWQELVEHWDPTGEYIRQFEQTLDPTTPTGDEANMIFDRFGDSEDANDLAATYPDTTTTTTSTKRPSMKIKTTTQPPITTTTSTTTTTTKRPKTTRRPTKVKTTPGIAVSQSPAIYPPSSTWQPETTISTTQLPTFHTIYQQLTPSSVNSEFTNLPSYGWRPTLYPFTTQFRPQYTLRPFSIPIVNSGAKFLGSLTDFGTRFIRAGSEVAGMVLSTVQALVSH